MDKSDILDNLIDMALAEDLGLEGDVTSSAIFNESTSRAVLVSKGRGILAGSRVFQKVFNRIDPELTINFKKADGEECLPGEIIAECAGNTLNILQGERTALNFLSYLSGIATLTSVYVKKAEKHGNTVILDTRKTLPGYRELAKYAVRAGGGKNHRMGLYDMVMIKDNHIDAAGSLSKAVDKVRHKWGERFRIEVECRNMEEVKEAVKKKVDIIMLDNMDRDAVTSAVRFINGRSKTEASGDMDLDKVDIFSSLGVDYISIGKLTHSVTAFNFSLQIQL